MKRALLASVLLASLPVAAAAHVLTPGPGTFSPDLFGAFPTGSIIASIIDAPFTSSLGASDFTGEYSTWVVRTSSGTLDFVYKFDDTGGAQDVNRVTGSSYTGFTTDVGDAGAGVSPTSVDRITGSPVGFNFANGIGAGQGSNFLIVDTNATLFQPGHISFINDGSTTDAAFSPAVPEPSTWALMIVGGLLLGGWKWLSSNASTPTSTGKIYST